MNNIVKITLALAAGGSLLYLGLRKKAGKTKSILLLMETLIKKIRFTVLTIIHFIRPARSFIIPCHHWRMISTPIKNTVLSLITFIQTIKPIIKAPDTTIKG